MRGFGKARKEVLTIKMDMTKLNSKKLAYLRSLAHDIKPVVHIGKEGFTEMVRRSISDALNTRELLKIKVLETAPETSSHTAKMLAESFDDITILQVMGRIITVYRPDPENSKLDLPE